MSRNPSTRLPASFRDPSGFLFRRNGVLYRQVNNEGREAYDRLMASGLYEELVGEGALIPHSETNRESAQTELAYRVLRPEPLSFISYPYEWCFGQLKDAALATLKIQKRALEYGMSLKDSSAYNIQFRAQRPVLIDTLSFEPYAEGEPWVAYRQFCQHFLAPLALMAYKDIRLGRLIRVFIDGIPLDLASRLLPRRTWFSPSLLTHLHLHAAAQRRYAQVNVRQARGTRRMSRNAMLGLVDSLRTAISRLRWRSDGTEWEHYYTIHDYSPTSLEHKRRLVDEYLGEIEPASVWDLGANTGLFSRLASRRGVPTVAFDIDPGAVETNYQAALAEGDEHLLPLVLDITNPSPSLGWANQERASLMERAPAEAVLALALIHHLAISNNVPLSQLADFFAQMGRWLIVEFVPKDDLQVQKLLRSREDIFPEYNLQGFENAFATRFRLRKSATIEGTQRRLYLMERV